MQYQRWNAHLLKALLLCLSLRLTDIAAGKLIIEEAGGIVTDGNGESLKLADSIVNKVYMVASNGCAHMDILKLTARG